MLKLGEYSKDAVDSLKKQNIQLWPEQTEQPKMPNDISALDSDELSKLFTKLTAWSNYVSGQLSAAQIDEKTIEKKKDFLEAKLFLHKDTSKVKGERVTLIKAQVMADEQYMELEEELLKAYAYRKMVEVVYNNFERDVSLVSREITRRTNDLRMNRKDKWSA